jgi:hypothetical protein
MYMTYEQFQDDEVDELVAEVTRRAIQDAQQSENPALAIEAWKYLDICAPTVATQLRRRQYPTIPDTIWNDT